MAVEEPLDRAGGTVPRRPGSVDRDLADSRAQDFGPTAGDGVSSISF